MALKFRRGTTAQKSGSLAFGEPYVNTTLGTLQVGLDTGDVTLATQGTSSLGQFGAISGSGLDITGNANIAGNLTLGGNITIGDNTSDTVTVTANLSSSLIPSVTNTFDLGSSTKIWRDLYLSTGSIKLVDGNGNIVNTITNQNIVTTDTIASGSVTLTNSLPAGTVSGSEQVVGILTSINTYTGSNNTTNALQTTRIDQLAAGTASVNSFTSSQSTTNTANTTRFQRLEESTASLNAFSASENTKSATLQTYTASVDTKFAAVQASTSSLNTFTASNGNTSLNTYTASNDTTNTTQNTRLTRLEESTASLNAFSASENTKSETLRLYTASVDAKFSTLATYTASVDTTNTAQNNRLSRLEESTASINLTTASLNGHVADINTWSASVKGHIVDINAYTASNNTTNTLQTTRIDQLAAGTSSVNLQTASVAGHISDINTYTSSLKTAFSVSGADLTVLGNLTVQGDTVTLNVANLLVEDKVIEIASGSTTSAAANGAGIFISGANASILWDNAASTLDINKSIDVAGNITLTGTVDGVDVSVQDTLYTNKFSTLQTYTASVDSTLARLRESTASLNAFSASENTKSATLQTYTASIDTKFTTLATYTGSNDTTNTLQTTRIDQLAAGTASVNTQTASVAGHIADINTKTGSFETKFTTLASVTSSALTRLSRIEESTSSLNAFTSSQSTTNTANTARFQRIEESTASLNAFSASENTKSETLRLYTASIDTKFSTLATYTGSNDTTNTTQNTRLTRIEESTSSLNTLTASLATTYEGRASAAKVLVSGSSQVNFTQLSGISANIISGSTNSTNVNFTISGGSITANLIGGVVSGSSQITAGSTTNFATDVKTQLNSNTIVSGSSQVNFTQLSGISANIISSSSDTSNVDMIINGGSISANLYGGVVSGSAQVVGMLASLNTYTGSNNTNISALQAETTALEAFTASAAGRLTNLESYSSSLRTAITVAGSDVTVNGNLTVSGTTTTINSTTVAIGDNIIQLNGTGATNGGIVVRDATAATTTSGSLLWDTTNDKWIAGPLGSEDDVVLRTLSQTLTNKTISGASNTLSNIANASLTNSSITIAGQSTALGGTVTAETIRTAIGTVVTGSAQISHDSTTGYSANRHIDHTAVTITAGSGLTGGGDISATRTISIATGGVTDSMLAGSISNGKLTNSSITIAGQSTALGSSVTAETIRTAIGTVVTGSAQIDLTATTNYATGILTRLNTVGVFSGSSQVSHDSTTGYSANRHIDHTAVSISAGSGLTGGGDISTTRTLSIANLGVTDAMLAGSISNAKLTNSAITIAGQSTSLGGSVTAETIRTAIGTVVTGSAQITGIGNAQLTNSSVTVTAGTGMSGGGSVSLGGSVTLTNAGVTSNVAGSGISVSGATGAVTITNTGVRSIAAGTGVSVSATTGDSCTISIGQSVATSATPTFDYIMTSNNGNGTNYKVGDDAWIGDMNTANTIKLKGVQDATAGYITFGNQSTALGLTNSTTLTWGASFTATGDVTAYSDRRVKENIKTIDGALDKVLKLRGVTYNRIDVDDKSEKIGVIAQEIQEVLPQVVHDENDKLSVAYGNLAGIFIEAIKEQQSQIHKLTLEIEDLKKQKGL